MGEWYPKGHTATLIVYIKKALKSSFVFSLFRFCFVFCFVFALSFALSFLLSGFGLFDDEKERFMRRS